MRIITDVELANDLIERAREEAATLKKQDADEKRTRKALGLPEPPGAWITDEVGVV